MTTTFENVIQYVIGNEGGYIFDPEDSGGATNWGVTQNDLSKWRAEPCSPDDVKTMPMTEAKNIYQHHVWYPMGGDSLNSIVYPRVCALIDSAVLYGLYASSKIIQETINNCGMPIGNALAIDGHIGPETLKCLQIPWENFIQTFVTNLYDHIALIVRSRRGDSRFQQGWVNRANKLLTL